MEAYASTTTLTGLEKRIRIQEVVQYIQMRQNEDGGYSFARGAESSAADTYYGIQVLKMLGAESKNVAKSIDFMEGLQHEDGSFDSVNVAYYVAKTLDELGAKPQKPLKPFVLSLQSAHGGFGVLEADLESPSELEVTYLSLELLKLVEHNLSFEKTKDPILTRQNYDGSFGKYGYSRLGATYHALASLSLLGFDVITLRGTEEWVRSCEIPSGGFRTSPPEWFDPYFIMDDIYFGVKCLDILGKNYRFPSQTLDLIAKFHNENGGFRRSVFLGISTFESTYHAMSACSTILARPE
jgi:hypothetical protein